MNPVKLVVDDLREKRLLPIALVLLAALVAIPVLLTKKSAGKPVASLGAPGAQSGSPGPATPPSADLPVVSVNSTPGHARLNAVPRDPFAQQQSAGGSAAAVSGTTSSAASSALSKATGGGGGSSGGSSSGGGSSTSSGSSSTGTTPKSTTTSTTPSTSTTTTPSQTPTPPKTVQVLSDTESYRVAVAMTNSSGGLNTLNPVQRLSVLPSKQVPLMVELGVLKGGKRVLFALQPGAVVSGPGQCTPGPVDCEVLSLAQDQIETLKVQTTGGVVPVTMFAVTAIKIDRHKSAGAARKARSQVSQAGKELLANSTSSALSLFQFRLNLGTLVNLANLKVGGGS